jgi:hypothetical protein
MLLMFVLVGFHTLHTLPFMLLFVICKVIVHMTLHDAALWCGVGTALGVW